MSVSRWFAFPLLITAVSVAAIRISAGEPSLGVQLAHPEGDVRHLTAIDVSFDAPMVRLGERGGEARVPVLFDPPLRGSWSWVGTSAASFLITEPPPEGTEITCRVPAGTKALAGRVLEEEFRWRIYYKRPRLLTSAPEISDGQGISFSFPPDDPLLLVFDRAPGEGASTLVRLRGATTAPLDLRPVTVDPSELKVITRRLGEERMDPARILAFRATLNPGAAYTLEIPANLPFEGTRLGLAAPLSIPFGTLPPPGVRSVVAHELSLGIETASLTDPDSLLAYLTLDPATSRCTAWEGDGTTIWIDGPFRGGSPVTVKVRAGLPDLFGRRTTSDWSATLTFGHGWPELDVEPWSGYMIPGPEEAVELRARNVGPVKIHAVWLEAEEWPAAYTQVEEAGGSLFTARHLRGLRGRWLPEVEWRDAGAHPDSLLYWRRLLDELSPPKKATALYLEAEAQPLFPGEDVPDTLRTHTLLQITSIGITSKLGRDHGLLWVTDLGSGQPIENAKVSLWERPGPDGRLPVGPLFRGLADSGGIVWTPGAAVLSPKGLPHFARVEAGERSAWLKLSLHEWNLDELLAERPPAAAVFTDRPLYRPGERIEWKAFVRSVDAAGLHPAELVKVVLRLEGRGEPILATASINGYGNASGHIALPPGLPTGTYFLGLYDGPGLDAARLGGVPVSVEAWKAPRFEARIDATPGLLLSGSSMVATGSFQSYGGGALGGAPVKWYLSLSPGWWQPRGWSAFTFRDEPPTHTRPADSGDERRPPSGPILLREGEGRLDREGRIVINQQITLPAEAGDMRATLEIGARDLDDQSAFARAALDVVRGPLRAGVRTLWDEQNERAGRVSWEWVVVDTAGTPRAGVPVVAELYRMDWKTVRVRRLGGLFDYENWSTDSLITRAEFVSAETAYRQTLPVPGPGEYRLRVWPKVAGGEALGAASRAWVAGAGTASSERPTTWWIPLTPDKETYQPDDTVRIVVPTPVGGAEALVTLSSGGLVRARRLSLSGTPRVEIPLSGLAPPDAVVNAVLVGRDRVPTQPGEGPRRFLPYHGTGNAWISIARDRWKASVDVSIDRAAAEPGDTVTVELLLKDAAGTPSAGEMALALVDEAVLALTSDNTRHPLESLFPGRGPGLVEDDLRSLLRLTPSIDRGKSSPGGGGSEGGSGLSVRTDFRATAYWNPSVVAGPGGRAVVRVPLPHDVTRYRLRVVAGTVGQQFAMQDAEITVSKPLEVEAATPRFARVGDRWTLGAVLRNRGKEALQVDLRAEVTGGRLVKGGAASHTLAGGETWRADFPIQVDAPGRVGYRLEASGRRADGRRLTDAVRRSIPIEAPVHREVEVAFGQAAPRAIEEVDLSRPGLAEAGRLEVNLSPSILAGLGDAVQYLTSYPHGCLEQLSSQTLGWLARRALADRLPQDSLDAAQVDAAIRAGVDRISALWSGDGFRLWPGGEGGVDPYLTGYALMALGAARQDGFTVPAAVYTAIDEEIRARLAETGAGALDPERAAFLTWIRLTSGVDEPRPGEPELEALFSQIDSLSAGGAAALGLAYHAYLARIGPAVQDAQASRVLTNMIRAHVDALVDHLSARVDRTARAAAVDEVRPNWGGAFSADGGRTRATSMAVLLLAKHSPNHPLLPLFARWLLDARRGGRWGNTHENAWALTAIREYAAKVEVLRLPIQARLIAGGTRSEGVRFQPGALAPHAIAFTLDALAKLARAPGTTLPLQVETEGQAPIFYDVRLDRSVPALGLGAREEGLAITREFVSVREQVTLRRLEAGEPALCHLAVWVPHDADYLLIEDPLPAGVEATNLRFRTTSALAAGAPLMEAEDEGRLPVTHRELYDDRVRFYADHVESGVYHIYYPISPIGRGTFGTPGARAELLYAPEVYGVSGALEVVVE